MNKITIDDKKLTAIIANIDKNRIKMLKALADDALDIALDLVPVDTGELKNTIAVEVQDDAFVLIAGTNHAAPIEYGTSKMMAQPFIAPAIEQAQDKIAEYGKQLLES